MNCFIGPNWGERNFTIPLLLGGEVVFLQRGLSAADKSVAGCPRKSVYTFRFQTGQRSATACKRVGKDVVWRCSLRGAIIDGELFLFCSD